MATRHLLVIVRGGRTRFANYGHSDGGPDDVGLEICKQLHEVMRRDLLLTFKKRVEALPEFSTAEEFANILNSKGRNDPLHPYLGNNFPRDAVAFIAAGNKVIALQNEEDFAGDSIFCEWVYVVDLDTDVFEVYSGCNTKHPADPEHRFFWTPIEGKGYPPVLRCTWKLSDLPPLEKFAPSVWAVIVKEKEQAA